MERRGRTKEKRKTGTTEAVVTAEGISGTVLGTEASKEKVFWSWIRNDLLLAPLAPLAS